MYPAGLEIVKWEQQYTGMHRIDIGRIKTRERVVASGKVRRRKCPVESEHGLKSLAFGFDGVSRWSELHTSVAERLHTAVHLHWHCDRT